jgi:hypothetical protein
MSTAQEFVRPQAQKPPTGRVVTQTSFHHFVDINLTGDPLTLTLAPSQQRLGADRSAPPRVAAYVIGSRTRSR